jgi:glutamate decarboxylase
MPQFQLLTTGAELPVFAFTATDKAHGWDVFAVSRALRERGWQVPAYRFPPNREDLSVLRIVVRNGFSHDLAELFMHDLQAAVTQLDAQTQHDSVPDLSGFHH